MILFLLKKYINILYIMSDILCKLEYAPFLFLSAHKNNYKEKLEKVLSSDNKNHEGYLLYNVFFSNENVEIIRKQLVLYVFNNTSKKVIIPLQNRNSIIIRMTYIYHFYAKNLPINITDQVRSLNLKVTESIGPEIISQIDQYIRYLHDSQNQPVPMDRPVNLSSAGTKTLPSVSTTFSFENRLLPLMEEEAPEVPLKAYNDYKETTKLFNI